MKGTKKGKNTLNLNLASVWWKLFQQGIKLLKKKIKAVSKESVGTDLCFDAAISEEKNDNKMTGFQSDIFSKAIGELGYTYIVSNNRYSPRHIIISIGKLSPAADRSAIRVGGYTKEAAVFFEKGSENTNYDSLNNPLWINLERFPGEKFAKQCADWIFKGTLPHHMTEENNKKN